MSLSSDTGPEVVVIPDRMATQDPESQQRQPASGPLNLSLPGGTDTTNRDPRDFDPEVFAVHELLYRTDVDEADTNGMFDLYNRAWIRASESPDTMMQSTKWDRIDRLYDSLAYLLNRPKGTGNVRPMTLLRALKLVPPELPFKSFAEWQGSQEWKELEAAARGIDLTALGPAPEPSSASPAGSVKQSREQVLMSLLFHMCQPHTVRNPLDVCLPAEMRKRLRFIRGHIFARPEIAHLRSRNLQYLPEGIATIFDTCCEDMRKVADHLDLAKLDRELVKRSQHKSKPQDSKPSQPQPQPQPLHMDIDSDGDNR